jgi:hypothetical protein
MSTRPAIIALLITLLLAVGAYFVLKTSGGGAPAGTQASIAQGERILTLDAAALKAITLRVPPAQPQVIDHNPDGRWYWRSAPRAVHQYPLDDNQARILLRLLTEAKGIATPQNDRPVPDSPPPVSLTLHGPDGDTTFRMSPRALGGQVLVDVATPANPTPRPAIISDDLLRLLTSPGPSAWRDTRALLSDPGAAARITFTDGSGANGFGLARREGQWLLTAPSPVAAPAEGQAVETVVRTLGSLNISRFYDDDASAPTAQTAGLDKPTAILTLEFDDRAIDPATQKPVTSTRTIQLRFGQPADTDGTMLYATPDNGATIYAVSAAPLSKLTAPASNLVMRAATRTLPADVGVIEIASPKRTLKLARDSVSGRWTESLDSTPPVAQDTTKAATSESILTFVTRTGADAVTLELPADAKQAATVALLSPSGQPLDRFDLFTAGNAIVLRSGTVCRFYTKPPDELIAWLARLSR